MYGNSEQAVHVYIDGVKITMVYSVHYEQYSVCVPLKKGQTLSLSTYNTRNVPIKAFGLKQY